MAVRFKLPVQPENHRSRPRSTRSLRPARPVSRLTRARTSSINSSSLFHLHPVKVRRLIFLDSGVLNPITQLCLLNSIAKKTPHRLTMRLRRARVGYCKDRPSSSPMCLGGGVTPNRYHPARRVCIGSLPISADLRGAQSRQLSEVLGTCLSNGRHSRFFDPTRGRSFTRELSMSGLGRHPDRHAQWSSRADWWRRTAGAGLICREAPVAPANP